MIASRTVACPPIPASLRCTARRSFNSTVALRNRPSIGPKPSLNIRHIRENPDLYVQTCIDRNYLRQSDYPQVIVHLFTEWKELQRNARTLRQRNNDIRTKLSHAKTFSGIEAPEASAEPHNEADLLQEAKQLKISIEKVESQEDTLNERIESLATDLPNLTSEETPIGTEPRVLGYINEHPNFAASSDDHTWRNHVHIGNEFDLLDFASAGTTTGWGWYYLKHEAALLEQALIQYAMSVAIKHGFSAVSPPSIVYTHIANACGFQPRDQGGEQQTYAIAQKENGYPTTRGGERSPEKTLAGTAEVPFAGMKANTTMTEHELPLRIVGASRCYRAEAGARGAETKGLYRVHEFTKVEMFAWTTKDKEQATFDAMLAIQKEILQSLGLHCRILEMPSADLGASAIRKLDIEAFFPSRREKNDGWGEVTSASICTDYQTRRLNTRVKPVSSSGKTEFPSTVNGTALAIPRVLAALLENGWNEREKRINIPSVLHQWMHGTEYIKKNTPR
ncbi:MAG: hypothetical protein LQ343_005445 [Gyalolechia ehrenbergii]|nr:MAG: hypothetical protein LQ343_005445 [Gyalolechia ehrenbergii]